MADETLEERVNKVTVSYNSFRVPLLDFLYPVNWAANFKPKKLGKYAQLQVPHRFRGVIKHDGKKIGRFAKLKDPNKDHKNIFYGVAYDTEGSAINPLAEWAEDTTRTLSLNDNKYSIDRRVAMHMGIVNGPRDISLYQREKRFFQSWYGLPFKLLLSPLALLLKPLRGVFGKDIVELGKLYELENAGLGDIKLDQSWFRQFLTMGLWKHYDLRDGSDNKVATISRNPLLKLLTLGLIEQV